MIKLHLILKTISPNRALRLGLLAYLWFLKVKYQAEPSAFIP